MTIGQLSRRTGVPIKVLRTYEDLGFLSTRGRSESNYRLFGEETVWCVQVVQGLRSLGLTLKAIRALVEAHCEGPDELVDGLLQEHLPTGHRPRRSPDQHPAGAASTHPGVPGRLRRRTSPARSIGAGAAPGSSSSPGH